MLQKPILHPKNNPTVSASQIPRDLEMRIRYLPSTMVASLDQRVQKLRRLAKYKLKELHTSQTILEQTPEADLSADERILLETLRLIDYIEYLRR